MGGPERLQPEGLSSPLGQYSHVSRARPGQLVFVAGQVPVDARGDVVGEGDLEAQVRQVFHNLDRALSAAGGTLESVLTFTTFLTETGNLQDFRRIRQQLFTELYPDGAYPANTLVVVTGLASPAFLVEIEAVAVV
jgi:enamine deaminase RidA (YjgF/YER057c/UK114 family)